MEKLVFILAIASLSVAQQYAKDPKEAAILSEKRYLSNNGQFGSAYTQEDGVQFTEESDQDGNRRGAYSYIDPTGKRRTITYTAGKNGFQASGDDLPVAPEAPVAPVPESPRGPAPQGPAPAQGAPAQRYGEANDEGAYHPIYDDVEYWERQSKSRPAAPAPAAPQWSAPAPNPAPVQWSAPAAPAPRAWSEPAAPVPQWRAPAPAAPQWRQPAPVAPEWSEPAPAAPQWRQPAPVAPEWSEPAPVPAVPSGRAQWSAPAAPARSAPQVWEYNTVASTEAPHRFFPPGKLDLNRSPDGFSYSFSKS